MISRWPPRPKVALIFSLLLVRSERANARWNSLIATGRRRGEERRGEERRGEERRGERGERRGGAEGKMIFRAQAAFFAASPSALFCLPADAFILIFGLHSAGTCAPLSPVVVSRSRAFLPRCPGLAWPGLVLPCLKCLTCLPPHAFQHWPCPRCRCAGHIVYAQAMIKYAAI